MLWFVTTVRLNLINWHPCTYLLIGARDDGSNRLPSLSCHWSGALEPPSPRQSGTIKCCPKTELGSFKSDLDRRHRQPGTSCVSRNSWLITIRPPTAAERALLRVWSRKENACLAIQINDSTDWGRGGGGKQSIPQYGVVWRARVVYTHGHKPLRINLRPGLSPVSENSGALSKTSRERDTDTHYNLSISQRIWLPVLVTGTVCHCLEKTNGALQDRSTSDDTLTSQNLKKLDLRGCQWSWRRLCKRCSS